MTWLTNILGFVTKPVTTYIEGRNKQNEIAAAEVSKALDREHEMNLKKVDVNMELAKQGMKIEADWDTTAQRQMTTSWKDEWFVFLFSIPLIASFFPDYQSQVLAGFAVLQQTPNWYMWLVIGIVSATFGLRWMFGKINLKR